jgi:hypothetical protein
MADPGIHLRSLERAAGEAQRTLEHAIAISGERWNDAAARGFEASHLNALREDARALHTALNAIAATAASAAGELAT